MAKKPRLTRRQLIIARWHRFSRWVKFPVYFLLLLTIFNVIGYGVSRWYVARHADQPQRIGTTFISNYAEYYDLDPKQALEAIFSDLGVRHIRLVSYWNEIEATKGTYDYSNLDWQMAMAKKYGADVTLSLGLRQPRWPECHAPGWVDQNNVTWKAELNKFIAATVDRYKNQPQLESYQLENEYRLGAFGECKQYGNDLTRLRSEFAVVKQHDTTHPVIISLSDNYGVPVQEPKPDIYGVSVYKRVYDGTITKRYFEYPLPPWYHSARSGIIEMISAKPSMIHELQTEPWGPIGVKEMPISEQDKTMNADLLDKRLKYARDTGIRTIDTWGAEWWLWRKDKLNDPSLWNVARENIKQNP